MKLAETYMWKRNMKSFSNKILSSFLQKVLHLLHFRSCQNCMSCSNIAAEIHWKFWNKRALRSGEPCTCEFVTLLQSFHRNTLSIHWYIAQNLEPTISISVLFRHLYKTAILSRFLKVIIATSNLWTKSIMADNVYEMRK